MSSVKLKIFKNTQFNKGLLGGYIVLLIDFIFDSTIYRGRYTTSYPFIVTCFVAVTIFMISYTIMFFKRGPLLELDSDGIVFRPSSNNHIRATWLKIKEVLCVQFDDAIESPEFLNQLCIILQDPINDVKLGKDFKVLEHSKILININLPPKGIEDTIDLIHCQKDQYIRTLHPAT